ncbi:MAG: DUF362 domain-containing protein [Muribaculaceae bacterium]|nr:DUF362 domain-containing protein [Muribaculaceae bacterium]
MKRLSLFIFSFIWICLTLVNTTAAHALSQCIEANTPVGEAKGIFPGRVVWSHSPGLVSWDESDVKWYMDKYINQEDCDWLLVANLCNLTGAGDEHEAWEKIFRYFNLNHHDKDIGYTKGELVTIKINNNNTDSHRDSSEINSTPQLVYSLIKSLVEAGEVPEECIIIAEPSRFITDYLFNKCHKDFPKVRFVDNIGGEGREKAEYEADRMSYSEDNGELATGIAKAFTDADYVINMALLKGHVGQGVTLCGKNWYGAMNIHSDWRKNYHNNFDQSRNGYAKYMTFVDFMGHKDLGGKCILWLIDGIYGCRNVGGAPGPRWGMAPFYDEWPNSLFGSLDPVAIDMVGVDFLTNEFPDMPDVAYSDMYLVEAAQADNPPSGASYTPSGDGIVLNSLGVAEHWNDVNEKQYTRNLQSSSNGIELMYITK